MNKSSKILIIQLVCMYLMHIPFYLILILAKIPNVSFETIEVLIIIGFVAMLVMIPVCLVSLIFACLNFVHNESSPLKTTLIVKIGLMPWYILNLLVCLLLVAGFLNPWLLIAVPLLICIEVGITYTFMLSTSVHSVIYTIRYLVSRKIEPNYKIVIALVFHFIFCLDIIGVLMLCKEIKKIGC